MAILRVKNWDQFQHYKDRSPAWIKLHRYILDDYDFQTLPVASRALAPMLWLLASEYEDGKIDATPRKLAFRLRMSEPEVIDALKPLVESGFFIMEHDASGMLAGCLPRGEERREEKEKEKEEEKEEEEKTPDKPARFDPLDIDLPTCIKTEAWGEWIAYRRKRKLSTTEQTAKAQIAKLAEWAAIGNRPEDVIAQSIANGWQGLFELKRKASAQVRQSAMNAIGVDDEIPAGFSHGH